MIDTGKWKTEINQLARFGEDEPVSRRGELLHDRRKVMKVRIRKKRSSKLALLLCRSLPLFKDHRRVRRGVGCDMQNTASITKVACKMRCQHAKLIDVWMRKMKSGSRQTRLKVRQAQCEQLYIYVKVLAQRPSLSLSPPSPHRTLSLFFLYLFPSIYLFSPLEGPQPNKEHRPQDIEVMLLRETILFQWILTKLEWSG